MQKGLAKTRPLGESYILRFSVLSFAGVRPSIVRLPRHTGRIRQCFGRS